jgi:hypothetical protein
VVDDPPTPLMKEPPTPKVNPPSPELPFPPITLASAKSPSSELRLPQLAAAASPMAARATSPTLDMSKLLHALRGENAHELRIPLFSKALPR